MDRGASDSKGSRNRNEFSLEDKVKEVVLNETSPGALDGTCPEDHPSEGEGKVIDPDQESSDALEGLTQDMALSLSKGKGRAVDSDRRALKTVKQEESLPKDKGKGKGVEHRIRFDVYDIPDQTAVESVVAGLADQPEHTGIMCDGPLCGKSQASIKGLRYKCTVCDNVNFCSDCVASFDNYHNATHAMVKCILPTTFKLVRKITDDAKRALMSECGDATTTLDDIMHVIHAVTKSPVPRPSIPESLDGVPEVTVFVIFRPRADEGKTRIPRIIEGEPPPNDGRFVTLYNIDEAGNVRVRHQPYGSAPSAVRDKGVMHHQDSELQMKVFTGRMLEFRYPSDGKFYRDARAGRLVTRVIDLQPGRFEDKLECVVREVELQEGPAYEALSYTWKETAYERAHSSYWTKEVNETFKNMSNYRHAVYCGDTFFLVNCGLRDALRRLRDPVETKTYWIDQLSIDQRNPSERALQVQRMRAIYNRAKRVIVWTGDEDGDTKPAFDIIRKLAMAYNMSEQPTLTPEELVADLVLDLPSLESSDWRSLLNFFLRPVFERMWVIQEIVVAQQVVVRCGDDSVTWSELSSAASLLAQGPWLRALPFHHAHQKTLFRQSRVGQVIMIKGFREDFHGLKELSIERLLYSTGIFEASDPRDKIYSLLGIRGARISSRATKHIQVDYKKSIQEVFIETTKAIVLGEVSFNICGLNGSFSSKTITGLPSWVPDYTSSFTSIATSFSRPDPPSPYSASGDSEPVAIWPYENQEHILMASSYKAGTIVMIAQHTILENVPLAPLISEWTSLASRCGPDYVTGEFTPDVFWRTCVADTTLRWRQSPAPLSYHQSLAAFFFGHVIRDVDIENDAEGSNWKNPVFATLAIDAVDTSDTTVLDSDDRNFAKGDPEAVSAFSATCRNRKCFVTANKYLGIGPVDAQAGDEVHILSGARVPFVFRTINPDNISLPDEHDPETQSYTMIGETYVHGLMKGEALRTDGFEWNGICIH